MEKKVEKRINKLLWLIIGILILSGSFAAYYIIDKTITVAMKEELNKHFVADITDIDVNETDQGWGGISYVITFDWEFPEGSLLWEEPTKVTSPVGNYIHEGKLSFETLGRDAGWSTNGVSLDDLYLIMDKRKGTSTFVLNFISDEKELKEVLNLLENDLSLLKEVKERKKEMEEQEKSNEIVKELKKKYNE